MEKFEKLRNLVGSNFDATECAHKLIRRGRPEFVLENLKDFLDAGVDAAELMDELIGCGNGSDIIADVLQRSLNIVSHSDEYITKLIKMGRTKCVVDNLVIILSSGIDASAISNAFIECGRPEYVIDNLELLSESHESSLS